LLGNWEADGEETRRIDRLVAEFIAADGRPFSSVEQAGFKRLVNGLCPNYKIK
jgi:hypothetical protein